ncbi:winged helix-turn-helix transcriptional regulator [Goodfellowiella coeruleoviolacea]|uniref:Transcriptional regulator, HxlR family n=1 Tax=Goodfellowiella coeruleoviolacea TaxID=334858 RepID=A0AAE3GA81_9PSEU|nr:helix-turn-helix domain-containing protein [Goodfellowiella coeruleoviolacea]MCP2164546.1 transcriptional regulator, HxlR family [Goodfellowiella coeruleoviolacea]
MSHSSARLATQVVEEGCPIVEVLDHVAGKWSIGIIVAAAQGPIRFTELERAIEGISRRMLTLTLRRLERDGLLVRTVYPTVPPKVEYTLTDMARELHESFAALVSWAERHRGAIATSRAAYDQEHGGAQAS